MQRNPLPAKMRHTKQDARTTELNLAEYDVEDMLVSIPNLEHYGVHIFYHDKRSFMLILVC